MELRQAEINQKEQANIRDNETKILIASIGSVEEDGIEEVDSSKREELLEKIRQFDEKLSLDKEKFSFEKEKHSDDVSLKRQALRQKPKTVAK